MTLYKVTGFMHGTTYTEVKAEDRDSAIEKAILQGYDDIEYEYFEWEVEEEPEEIQVEMTALEEAAWMMTGFENEVE